MRFPPPVMMAAAGYMLGRNECEASRDECGSGRDARPCGRATAQNGYREEYRYLVGYVCELKKLYQSVSADAASRNGTNYPPPPEGFVASIQARISSFRFFGAGEAAPSLEKRSYSSRFQKNQTRYIWFEYTLRHISPGRRIDYAGVCDWYHLGSSKNTRIGSTPFYFHILPEWEFSHYAQGTGWSEAGKWTPGTYAVLIFIEGEFAARRTFEVF